MILGDRSRGSRLLKRQTVRMSDTSPALVSAGRAATIVGAGMVAMNGLAYAFTLGAAHVLGPTDFGVVAALLGVILVANVGSLTIQATAARRLATTPGDAAAAVRRDVLATGRGLSVAVALLLLVATPLLSKGLQLDDWLATAMVVPTCAALTMMGAYAGIVQGERRWTALAAIYLSMGVGRVAAGGIALVVDPSARSAMIGVAVASLVPLVVGWRLCSGGPEARGGSHRPLLAELWRNGHTLLAFFSFTNLDVLLARHLFSHHDAGIYAGGAILTKACLFLPTFVLVVAFPSMAADRGGRAWLRPMLLVLALGGCAVVAALVLPGLAESFAGGHAYVGLGHVAWVFALEGTLFAAVQILVYDTIAGQSHAGSVLWLGVLGTVAFATPLAHSVAGLAGIVSGVTVVAGIVVAALLRGAGTRAQTASAPSS